MARQKIGVISDTHGLLRASAREALAGVSMIIHAGDVGSYEVLAELRELAPVTAVRGNVDVGPWAEALAASEVMQLNGANVYALHDLGRLDFDPASAGFDVVISGHSHRPVVTWRGGVLYLNPGSAGPRRFRLPVSLALLTVGEGAPEAELLDLARE